MKNAKISRRSFLLGLAACSAAGILTACKGDDTPASSASTSPEAPASSVSELEPIGLFTVEDFPKLDGVVCDLRTPVEKDCTFEVCTFDSEDGKKTFWHTASTSCLISFRPFLRRIR